MTPEPGKPFVGRSPGARAEGTVFAQSRFLAPPIAAAGTKAQETEIMIRYGFTIRTRTGQRIENVSIIAGSQNDAERRLRQMYLHCEVLECRERSIPRRFVAANGASMIDLLAISPPTIQHHG